MKSEEMTSLERIAAALQYQKPDRVPVAPLVCGASHRVLGTTYDKWSMDADLATRSLLAAHEIIGFDSFLTLVDLSVEAYDFGQDVIFPKTSTAYSNTNNPLIKTVEDYYKLKPVNPRETKRMGMIIDMCAGLSKARGKDTAVIGFVYGPLGVLSQLRGHERMFMDCIRHPEAVLQAVEVLTEVLIDYAKAQIEAGAHAVCIDTLYASGSIMSKKMWEKFEGPFAKRIADVIRDSGAVLLLHNCGNKIYFDVQEKWLHPVAISHAYPADDCVDWDEHARKWGKKIVTIGYSVPSDTAIMMSPEEIMEDCRKQIETFKDCNGGFILATGCEFPPNGNLLSAIAMVKAAKKYGKYR
ncbi:uroporphyrinogen decarboxylase family protein [Heliobacterium mobile]|nr:uroporphyrinogen decarboxylase family protein [Heliobacterium mobile]